MKTIVVDLYPAIFAIAMLLLAVAGSNTVDGSVVCVIAVLASMPYQARRAEQLRRGKEILNRYSPERSSRPLGL
jgi:hypothetical protein